MNLYPLPNPRTSSLKIIIKMQEIQKLMLKDIFQALISIKYLVFWHETCKPGIDLHQRFQMGLLLLLLLLPTTENKMHGQSTIELEKRNLHQNCTNPFVEQQIRLIFEKWPGRDEPQKYIFFIAQVTMSQEITTGLFEKSFSYK